MYPAVFINLALQKMVGGIVCKQFCLFCHIS